jgi:hypothetical protein
MLFAILDRGWAFAAIVAPFAMLVETCCSGDCRS